MYPRTVAKLLLNRWVLFAVVLPVLAWALDRIGHSIEEDHGSTRASRILRAPRPMAGEPAGLQAETAKLGQAARAKDEAGVKQQFQAVLKSCNGCHDDFRTKQ